jgi:hypothetical protein
MKIAFRLLFCLLALALLTTAGCRRSKERKLSPSQLAGELRSGTSFEDAKSKLGVGQSELEVLDDREPLPSDTRPTYRVLLVSWKRAKVFGQPGELVMTFYNDRLMTTQFYAADITAARGAVEREQKLSLGDGQAHIEPSTRVWVGKDEQKRSYIGWIDKVLQAEQEAWQKQYEK